MRIYNHKYYVLTRNPGIGGFQSWKDKTTSIVTGWKAKNHRSEVVREYRPTGAGLFRLDDGHLPENQTVMDETSALRWLDRDRFREIVACEERPATSKGKR